MIPPAGGWTYVRDVRGADAAEPAAELGRRQRKLHSLYGRPLRALPTDSLIGQQREAAFHNHAGRGLRVGLIEPGAPATVLVTAPASAPADDGVAARRVVMPGTEGVPLRTPVLRSEWLTGGR